MKKIFAIMLVIALALSITGCNKSSEIQRFIMADVQPEGHPSAIACDKFAELVEEKTDGRIVIEVYHGSTLGTESEQMQQITVGGIDFARISSPLAEYHDELKALQSLFLFSSEDQMWRVLDGNIGDELLYSKALEKSGVEGLCWFSGGSRNFYNSKKSIESPSDLSGMTIRVNTPSLFSFLEKCGATGVNIAYGDIYNSITKGVVAGAENNWPSYISAEHYKAAKYITVDEHSRIPEMIVASANSMSLLSEEDQKVIHECAKEISEFQRKAMSDYEAEAIETAKKAGCVITYLNDSQKEKFKTIGDEVNADIYSDYINLINKIKAVK